MSDKINFVGEYLLSSIGGAEKSIYNELKEISKRYCVKAYTFDKFYKKGIFKKDFEIINFGLKKTFDVSRFIEIYYLNEKFITKKLNFIKNELINSEFIITQTLIAPIVADFCIKHKIKYHYYLRDELQLNIFKNYEKGFRYILKLIKTFVELPLIEKYKKMNEKALLNADKIIVNSKFMQKFLYEKFGLKSEVKYPKVDEKYFLKIKFNKKEKKYITFIGGENAMKGYDIVLKIAKKLPEEYFLIVGPYKKKFSKKNILFIPFQKNILNIYKKTKILLVPSRWNEAFGRTVVEANLLGIPAITSNRGGLPESNKNKDLIIENLENIEIWIEKIKKYLKYGKKQKDQR